MLGASNWTITPEQISEADHIAKPVLLSEYGLRAVLDAPAKPVSNPDMTAILSPDGKISIPPGLAESAQLKPGDTLDVQLYKGTIVLRKHQPLALDQCADLLERSRSQPAPTPEDDAAVAQVIQDVRSRTGFCR